MSRRLPRGLVTFAFVDVVSSTKIFVEHGEAFVGALSVVQERIRRHTTALGGVVVKTEGDGAFLAFQSAQSAVEALVGLQVELARVPEDTVPRLQVRVGLHSGDAVPVGDDYVALAVNVAARVTSAAGAGQVVATRATQAELASPAGVCVGDYDLKDVADPVQLWRVCGDATPLRAPVARRTNVRVPATGFVGRSQDLGALRDLVAEHRMVTVLGPGGLGKTRLASELTRHIAVGVYGGAWLVELASLHAGDQIPGAVGQVLGIQASDVGSVGVELRRRGEVLLVLDNCEHLIDSIADVASELLEACPELRVLCTSREPLQVHGELVWRLPPLVDAADRIELFSQRALASGATVPPGAGDLVNRLCAALDGLPLAIELAATQAGSTSLEELVLIAEHGSDDLTRRGGHLRQRSLDAVLAWSLDCLPVPRRASLLVLSTLPGRFDREMASAILSEVEQCEADAVRPLARASLIDLDGENYRILDTIRHAARRRLSKEPELAHAAKLGLRAWAQEQATAMYGRGRTVDDVPAERLLALEQALESAANDGAAGMGKLWDLVRAITSHQEPGKRIVALAEQILDGPLPASVDDVLCFNGAVHVLQLADRLSASDDRLEAICAAADVHGVCAPVAALHSRLVVHYAERGHADDARRHADVYTRFLASPDANSLHQRYVHQLGVVVAYAAGNFEEALAHAERDLLAARASASEIDLDVSEGNVADLLLELGRPEEALPHAVEAVRACRLPGPARRGALRHLAVAQTQLGDDEAALAVVREIESELIASGRPPHKVEAELTLLRDSMSAAAPRHGQDCQCGVASTCSPADSSRGE